MNCGGGLVLALTLVLAPGCGGGACTPAQDTSTRTGEPSAAGSARGAVVARVDGEPIWLAEVQQLCSATGLPAEQALQRLVSERLLVKHASKEGYGELAVVERAVRQARVRALLARTVEASGSAPTPSPPAIAPSAARVAEQKDQLDRLLAQLAKQSGVAYDEAAITRAFKPDEP